MEEVAATASKGLPARLEGDGPVCGLLARSRHAYPMDPRRSWLRKPGGRRSPAALSVLADLASEVSSSKKRLGNVNTSPVDGFWRLAFAGDPHGDQCHCSSRKSGRSASAPALDHQPFFATDGPQTTLRSTSRSVAVTSPVAGRDRAGRPSVRCGAREAHLPRGAPLLPNEAGAEEGGRRPKKRSAKKAEEATIHRSSSKRLSPTPLYNPLAVP